MRMIVAMVIVAGLTASSALAVANPASENCVKAGGTLEIVKLHSGGEIGLCHLPDRQEFTNHVEDAHQGAKENRICAQCAANFHTQAPSAS